MARIITHRHTEIQDGGYVHEYCWKHDENSGFSFPCDEHGQALLSEMHECGRNNWAKVQSGEFDVIDQGVRHDTWEVRVPAVLECDCGRHLSLHSAWANTCKCGREFNGFGQQLAPRSQWGEETGESIADMECDYDPEEVG